MNTRIWAALQMSKIKVHGITHNNVTGLKTEEHCLCEHKVLKYFCVKTFFLIL